MLLIFTGAPPVFFTVIFFELVVTPSWSEPKPSEVGETLTVCAAAGTPQANSSNMHFKI